MITFLINISPYRILSALFLINVSYPTVILNERMVVKKIYISPIYWNMILNKKN